MKKLFLASIVMLAMTTACTNSESLNSESAAENPAIAKAIFSKDSDVDYLAKDGRYYVLSASEVYFMGEKLVFETGETVDLVQASIRNEEFAREARTQCKFTMASGVKIYLTEVYGDGQNPTYWVSFVGLDGTISTVRNTSGLTCNKAFAMFVSQDLN